jgi:hypothetical protein
VTPSPNPFTRRWTSLIRRKTNPRLQPSLGPKIRPLVAFSRRRCLPAKTSVLRDVGASDGAGEMTVAELDEQRRQQEADRANKLYDLPMDPGGDNPRFDEPVMDRFSAEIPDDMAAKLQPGEGEQIGRAFIAAGLGNTTAASFMRMGVEASRRGPLSEHQIQQRNTAGMAALTEKWGDQMPAKLELARGMIRQAEKQWPGLKDYLNRTGLGSDPKLIQQLVARAERRPGRGR